MSLTIHVDISGASAAAADVQAMRNALANRRPLHAHMGEKVQKVTRDYLIKDTNHKTATKLGATPTGHRAKLGAPNGGIEYGYDAEKFVLRIPRSSGLGRAFYDMVILPGSGKKFLTIPACAATYGKSARDFSEGVLKLGTVQGRFMALVFADTNNPAFWLVRKVHQKQDRTLLPLDEDWRDVAVIAATEYLTNLPATA